MNQLIENVAKQAGLEPATAEKAIGTVFALLQEQSTASDIDDLIGEIPGAAELAARNQSSQGGFLAKMGGASVAAFTRLSGIGLNIGQIELVGRAVLDHAEEKLGPEKTARVIASVPGLDKLL